MNAGSSEQTPPPSGHPLGDEVEGQAPGTEGTGSDSTASPVLDPGKPRRQGAKRRSTVQESSKVQYSDVKRRLSIHTSLQSDLLAKAAARVLRRWEGMDQGWVATPEEVSSALSEITRAVSGVMSGEEDADGLAEPTRPRLQLRLAGALRAEILAEWKDSDGEGDPTRVLDLLSTLEEYLARIWKSGRGGLERRMSESDAFELVVEMAHDLRSPLNSVLFLSEVLRSGHSGSLSPQQRSQVGLIYSATMGVLSVVSDVVDSAKDERGLLAEEEAAPLSIRNVFDSVERMVRPMAEEKEISLEFQIPGEDQRTGHANLLARALLNLTTNAVKFTESGGVTVAATRLDGCRVEFSVRDSGRGMPEEQVKRLFQPFQKAASRPGYYFSGSGLGLSIAQRMVTAMGSRLELETEPGKGTRFYFVVAFPSVREH